MLFVVDHPTFVFFLFAIPLLGWATHRYFTKKTISCTLITSSVLLLPALTGYSYVVNNAYSFLFYVLLTFGYALILKTDEYKFWPTAIISALLFPCCLFLTFMGGLAGKTTVEREWTLKGYKIVYTRDQGFAGHALMTYELSKYALIPIFIKQVAVKVDEDTTNACWIKFDDAGFNFNKCDPDSSNIVKH